MDFLTSVHYLHKDCKDEEVKKAEEVQEVGDNDDNPGKIRASSDAELAKFPKNLATKFPRKPVARFQRKAVIKSLKKICDQVPKEERNPVETQGSCRQVPREKGRQVQREIPKETCNQIPKERDTKIPGNDKEMKKKKKVGEVKEVGVNDDDPDRFRACLKVELARTFTGVEVFAALKGAAEKGLFIPHSEKRFPRYDSEAKPLKADVYRAHIVK